MNGLESGHIWALIGALGFGIVYAVAVYIPLYGKHGGYTSLLVAFGTAVTLAACIPMIGLVNVLYVVAAFIATGTPMIAGEAIRTKYDEFKHREEMAERIEQVTHVNETERVAEQRGLGEGPGNHGGTGGA